MVVLDGVEMVGVQEAARIAGRTPETIRRWVWSGRLAATKQGNRLFVPRAALIEGPHDSNEALRAWATEALSRPRTQPDRSARDLVLADREHRAGR